MATVKIRHLVIKPGAAGPRYYWQPSAALREAGWRPERLAVDEEKITSLMAARGIARARAVEDLAHQEAKDRNEEVDGWRAGLLPPHADPRRAGPAAKTLSHLIALYRKSENFTDLKDNTRRVYASSLKVLETWGGDIPWGHITRAGSTGSTELSPAPSARRAIPRWPAIPCGSSPRSMRSAA